MSRSMVGHGTTLKFLYGTYADVSAFSTVAGNSKVENVYG